MTKQEGGDSLARALINYNITVPFDPNTRDNLRHTPLSTRYGLEFDFPLMKSRRETNGLYYKHMMTVTSPALSICHCHIN